MTGHALRPARPGRLAAPQRLLALRARLRAGTLDRHLAAGVPSSRTPLHEARARQLTDLRRRGELVAALDALIASAHDPRPGRRPWAHAVAERTSVLGCESQLTDLAARLAGDEPVDAHGVAALRALLADHRGPLYVSRHTGELARELHRIARATAAAGS